MTNFLDSKDKSYDVSNTASAHIQVKLGGSQPQLSHRDPELPTRKQRGFLQLTKCLAGTQISSKCNCYV